MSTATDLTKVRLTLTTPGLAPSSHNFLMFEVAEMVQEPLRAGIKRITFEGPASTAVYEVMA